MILPKSKRPADAYCAIVIIILALIGRGLLMELTDLLDPTESRYASVAQEMVESGNWLTPMLPMPEGMVPYMGKPPLHFWLTALSYRVFGVEEWTTRLPSFLAALGILWGIFVFTRKRFGEADAIAACAIAFSSVLLFFLSGASVTDVTLTFTVTASVICLYQYISPYTAAVRNRMVFAAAAFAALGFLCKGPVSLILIWLPFMLWSLARRDFRWVRSLPWVRAAMVFLAVTVPWFIASEFANPGFIRYFFWNENVARYLFKEYGDRYGSGHVHAYGTSWLLLLGAFAPWSVALLFVSLAAGRTRLNLMFREHPALSFVACWALAAPLFFTFVRQLHIMYLLPAIPPLAVLTAVSYYHLLPTLPSLQRLNRIAKSSYVLYFFIALWVLEITIGVSVDYSLWEFSSVLALAATGLLAVAVFRHRVEKIALTSTVPALLVVSYLIAIGSVTPFLAEHQSAELALKSIPHDARCQNHSHKVGVTTENTFSHYWTARAWESELNERMIVEYVAPNEAARSDVCHLLIEAKHADRLSPQLKQGFTLVSKTDSWWVYGRRPQLPLRVAGSPSNAFTPL